jgi:hypothetical protein
MTQALGADTGSINPMEPHLMPINARKYKAIKSAVVCELVKQGWTAPREFDMEHTYHCGSMEFETAVGGKDATVRLEPFFGELSLFGHYECKGQDVLSTSRISIPLEIDQPRYAELIEQFTKDVIARVDQSYARRLHLSRIA